jgi:hypothetical protein
MRPVTLVLDTIKDVIERGRNDPRCRVGPSVL